MIGTIDIEIQAKNPNMPLWPLRAYVNSPSSLRIRNVPKKIGQWEITSVQVAATYPDKTQKTAQCVLVGGVWVGTIEGSPASGTCTNGYTVIADGIDENGNPVNGYVLGRGDVEILKEDGTPIEDPTHFVTDDELDAAISSKAEISDVDDVANDLADLSNSLSDYYTKSETSSATEIQTALDNYITSAQVEPAQFQPGYAAKSEITQRVVKEVGTTVDESTYLATVQADSDKSTDAVIRSQTYDSFFLSSYNGQTFDPPIELKYGYCTRVYKVITISGRERQVYVSINSNAWYAQLERTFHLIKAEYTRPYYWPVESMYLSATSYPVTYNENKTSIETVNGQSGIIACSRATHYPTESAWPLAYRDEVSAKADLSSLSGYYTKNETSSAVEISTALNLKQDKLTDAQVSAIDSVVDERKTVVKYDDNSIVAYDIDGTLSQNALDVSGKNIIEVKMGNAVTAIGPHCFDNYKQLVNVYIPNSVTTIDRYAFTECDSLTGLLIPESVTTIGDYAFYGCDSLTSEVIIPDSVTSIGEEVFVVTHCPKFVIGSGVTNIGRNVFLGNGGRIEEVIFRGKTLAEVQSMTNYPWSISDTSIIKTWNVASQEWVLEQLSALEARIAALENN